MRGVGGWVGVHACVQRCVRECVGVVGVGMGFAIVAYWGNWVGG